MRIAKAALSMMGVADVNFVSDISDSKAVLIIEQTTIILGGVAYPNKVWSLQQPHKRRADFLLYSLYGVVQPEVTPIEILNKVSTYRDYIYLFQQL